MRISRIYSPEVLKAEDLVQLNADASHHVANVLRYKPGQAIVLFNGDGNEYSAELVDVSKRKVTAIIDAKLSISLESLLNIHLGQVVSRGERMEWVLQKSVELGVKEITPLLSERCGVNLSEERWQKKHQQWLKIIIAACEQCGRNTLPSLHFPIELSRWTSQSTQQSRLTLHPHAQKSFKHLALNKEGVRLLIGPEGGFSEQEVYQTEEAGFQTVLLGPRVLRTETAALAAISALQACHGDF